MRAWLLLTLGLLLLTLVAAVPAQEVEFNGSSGNMHGRVGAQGDMTVMFNIDSVVQAVTPSTVVTDQVIRIEGIGFVEVQGIVTRPPDEVFEDLIEGGQLIVVWRYNNATQDWDLYAPNAPDVLIDLEVVSTGDILWVHVAENVTFQGYTLYAGWNLISLE